MIVTKGILLSTLVRLRDQGYTMREIAAQVGCSAPNVCTRLGRYRRRVNREQYSTYYPCVATNRRIASMAIRY